MIVPPLGYNAYPVSCRFPGCDRRAPVAEDGGVPLCADHERLRFYAPLEFAKQWRALTLGR